MLRRAAAALRSTWPFDSWDVVGLIGLAGIGVSLNGLFGFYTALGVLSALLLGLALLVALRQTPSA